MTLPGALIDSLRALYAEPHRHYHTQQHIDSLLAELHVTPVPVHDLAVVEAAIWFHDAIYDTRRQDNEARSAELADMALSELGWAPERSARVVRLILATADHSAAANDPDAALFLDLDLSILGSDPATYAAYAAAIRREFAWVNEPDYRAGRARVLTRFLAQERLFRTDYYRERLEAAAQRNLRRERALPG
jgi:predicted metal-dependent HD superfamily phosphohydrolase